VTRTRREPSRPTYLWHAWRREWTNFSFRRHRRFDAYIVTMHQSGTHWLKYLLSLVIAREHGLPPPRDIGDSLVIGGPHTPARHPTRPYLGMSHTIANPLLGMALAHPSLGFPRYVVLVRDIRDSLVSHFRKWEARYACTFSEYLRGDIRNRRFDKDIWWDLRFMNAWGSLLAAHPGRTLAVHYEALQADPVTVLHDIVRFVRLPLAMPDDAIADALASATKAHMAERDPHVHGLTVVRDEPRDWDRWWSADDRAWLRATCARHLKWDFGYAYAEWR
jgi:hypothetical protein